MDPSVKKFTLFSSLYLFPAIEQRSALSPRTGSESVPSFSPLLLSKRTGTSLCLAKKKELALLVSTRRGRPFPPNSQLAVTAKFSGL